MPLSGGRSSPSLCSGTSPNPPRAPENSERPTENPARAAFVRLFETFRGLRDYKHAFLLLTAFWLYSDGIATIIRMAALYGQQIGLKTADLILGVLLTQFVGVPFAIFFGLLAGRMGPKRCIFIGIAVYCSIPLVGYFMTTAWHFWLLAVLVGTVQGGTQALSRSLFASMIPASRSGEFFGLFSIMDRFSGLLGSTAITGLALATGDARLALLFVTALFIIGGLVLTRVNVAEGRRQAGAPTPTIP